jgi:hypothetical protein
MTARIAGAGLLLAAGIGDAVLEVASLHHMPQFGIGWFWDDYHAAPYPWWPWLVLGHVAVAAAILSGWRPGLAFGAALGAILALIWTWLTVVNGIKLFRVDAPEPYLVVIPLLFVLAYIAVAVACLLAVRRADVPRLAE